MIAGFLVVLVANSFAVGAASTSAEDVAVMANGDLVTVGCEARAAVVTRIDHASRKPVWVRRATSPCNALDNWTVPRVAVSTTGTIWVAAFGWGHEIGDRTTPTAVLAFTGTGALGAQRELASGERVRAMIALPDGKIAIAGQSGTVTDRSTAFVAAIDAAAKEAWRAAIPGASLVLISSLALDRTRIFVGGEVPGTVEVVKGVAVGREGDGVVTTLDAATGATLSATTRHYPGVNVSDVFVAIVNGSPIATYDLGLRVGNPWPATLPSRGSTTGTMIGTILVEPIAAKPAWSRLLVGSTYLHTASVAGSRDRIALTMTMQQGAADFGTGSIASTGFDHAAYVELDAATGNTLAARPLDAGRDRKAFFRRVIWDGAAFTAVGTVHDAAFVWRIGT